MIAAPLSRVYWKVLSHYNILPGEERAERINDAQLLWAYLNIVEDEKEKQAVMHKQLEWLKWYINPKMAKWVKEREIQKDRQDSDRTSMTDDDFMSVMITDMRNSGATEDEIYDALVAAKLIKEE